MFNTDPMYVMNSLGGASVINEVAGDTLERGVEFQ